MELDQFPDIITAASGSPLGIVALALLLLALIAWLLFVKGGQSSERTRLGVYGMFTAGVLFLAIAILPDTPDASPSGADALADTAASALDTAAAEGAAPAEDAAPAEGAAGGGLAVADPSGAGPGLARGVHFYSAPACAGDLVQSLAPGQPREVRAAGPIHSLRLVDAGPARTDQPLVIGLSAGPRTSPRALVFVQRAVADYCVASLEHGLQSEAVRLERSGGGTLAGEVRRIRLEASR